MLHSNKVNDGLDVKAPAVFGAEVVGVLVKSLTKLVLIRTESSMEEVRATGGVKEVLCNQ